MSLQKPNTRDGGLIRSVAIGDLLGAAEIVGTLTTAGAGSITGAILANNIINRTGPTGAVADTFDTASNILAAVPGCQQGDSWRVKYINTVAFALTLTANTGVTITGNATVNASSVKEFLVTVTNATPAAVVVGNTVSGSAVLTGLDASETILLSPGMLVTGTGIQAASTILSVQPGIGITLSLTASATGTNIAFTCSPTVTIQNLGQGLL